MDQIDKIVTDAMKAFASKGRGQVLGLLRDPNENQVTIELKESLKPTDETEKPALYRQHVLDDLQSFIEYALKYGQAIASLIIVSKESAVLVIDEKAKAPAIVAEGGEQSKVVTERGLREKITYKFHKSDDWTDWKKLIDDVNGFNHRQMLRFMAKHEHNLKNPDIMISLRTLKVTNTVNIDSDIQEDAETIGVMMKTNGGDQLKQFKKSIPIILPILDQDVLSENAWVEIEIKLDVDLPTETNKGPVFSLSCSKVNQIYAKRVSDEAQAIREDLGDGWLVVMGEHQETARSYLRGDIVQDNPPHMPKSDRNGRDY